MDMIADMQVAEAKIKAGTYYLQDSRSFIGNCMMWHRKGGSGYTSNLDEAEKYTFAAVMRMHKTRDTDVPWLCSEMDLITGRTVDMQLLRTYRTKAQQIKELRSWIY